jgi:hypothetical protein
MVAVVLLLLLPSMAAGVHGALAACRLAVRWEHNLAVATIQLQQTEELNVLVHLLSLALRYLVALAAAVLLILS